MDKTENSSEITEEEAYGLYLSNLSDTAGFYARDADDETLVAFYKIAFERGRGSVLNNEEKKL